MRRRSSLARCPIISTAFPVDMPGNYSGFFVQYQIDSNCAILAALYRLPAAVPNQALHIEGGNGIAFDVGEGT